MIDRVRGFFKKIPNHLMLGIGIFILVVGGYIFSMQGQVNSPDENANLVFARTWKSSQTLFVSNKVAPPTAYPLFPRSVSIVTNGVRPGGFIGLSVLYGSLSIFFGDTSLFYWTLFFTIIAALGWWFLIRRMFGREIADISFWLFLFHPAVLYYSARGLFPNELLLDFTIIAIAAAWYAWEHPRKNIVMILLAIISTLSAIAVRPPEALVIFGIVCVSIMIWSSDRRIRARALTGLGGCAFIAALFFIARLKNWLPGGYQFVELNSVSSLFFPFGIHFKLVAHAVYDFTVRLFTVWSVLPAVGVMWWALESIKEKKDRLISAYVTVIASVSVWLFVAYGSWAVADNPVDPLAITLGLSYVRYWLPIFVFATPFIAWLFVKILEKKNFNDDHARLYARIFVGIFVALGFWRAIIGVDGLNAVAAEVRSGRVIVRQVEAQVPQNAVLAVRTWDKHFFPDRAILQPFPSDVRALAAVKELRSKGVAVYAFIEALTPTDENWLRDNGLVASMINVYGTQRLYALNIWTRE